MRGALPILLLFGLALATTWYLQRVERQLASEQESRTPAELAEGWNVELLATDAEGQPAYRLVSPHVTEAAGELGTDFVDPVLTLYEPDRPPAQASADKAWLAADQALLRLDGNVNLRRPGAKGGAGSRLETRWLLVYPALRQAATEAEVLLSSPGQRYQGVGLRADLSQEHYELLSEVRGRHEATLR